MIRSSLPLFYNLIISPHIDDAFLSLGGMIARDSSRPQKVLDIFSTSKFAPRSKCPKGDVDCVSKIRKEEELENCKSVRAEVEFLQFSDSELRGYPPDPEFTSLEFERPLQEEIKRDILARMEQSKRVFFPLGIGRHIDHAIVNKVGLELIQDESALQKTYFYEDLPYAARKERKYSLMDTTVDTSRIQQHLIPFSWRTKWKMCRNYESQFSDKTYRRILGYGKRINILGAFSERVWTITDMSYVQEILALGKLSKN